MFSIELEIIREFVVILPLRKSCKLGLHRSYKPDSFLLLHRPIDSLFVHISNKTVSALILAKIRRY